ncbi:MAG: LacI family DNA-binding transcriptional regulator [Leifsonia sp.]
MAEGRARTAAPTLEMVAREAGVSRATVSRVVNGSPKVSPDVAASVNEAIDRLHYVPNRAARSLASRTTGAIALVVPEDTTRFFGDPYFAAVVKGITRRLDSSEYLLNLLVASSDPGHKTAGYLRSGIVDGALVISHHSGDDLLNEVANVLPLVFGGRPSNPSDDAYYVDVDNVAGGDHGTQHIIDLGRRRIGSISGPQDMPAGIDRLTGFRRAIERCGLPVDAIEMGDFTAASGAEATRRLLDRVPDLDGLFVASDLMATGAFVALRERGLSVPGDVAVVGFDDSPAALSDIPLTTVSQPSEEMGYAMADTLVRLLEGDRSPAHRNIMPTRLIIRDSA